MKQITGYIILILLTIAVSVFALLPNNKIAISSNGLISFSLDKAEAQTSTDTVETTSWGYRYTLQKGDIVEVGNSSTPGFQAHVKTIRGNCFFSLGLTGGTFSPTLDGLIVSFPFNTNIDVQIYPVSPGERLPDGGIEYNVILKKKIAQTTISMGIDWQGMTWRKVLGLDSEYTEAMCEDLFGTQGAPYTRTPTQITGADGITYKTRQEYEVNSYVGEASVPSSVHDENWGTGAPSYTRLSTTNLYIHRGKMTDALGATAWVEDINIDEAAKTITFALPKEWLRTASYPINQVCGVDPAYTQAMDSFTSGAWGGSDGVWGDYDIYTNKSIPKGAVVEFILSNSTTGTENTLGVRTDGSSLSRTLTLHEAESGGTAPQTHARMFVTVHASTGIIECYHSDVSDGDYFYIVGYWQNVSFTETYTTLVDPNTVVDAWNITSTEYESDGSTGSSVSMYNGSVTRVGNKHPSYSGCTISGVKVSLYKSGSPTGTIYCRIRRTDTDAILGTVGTIESDTLGITQANKTFYGSPVVVPDSTAIRISIEFSGGDASNYVNMQYASSFASTFDKFTYDGSYTDTSTDACYVAITKTPSAIVGKVCHVTAAIIGEYTYYGGIRETGSALDRKLLIHEAEAGGNNYLDYLVKLDSNGTCESYNDIAGSYVTFTLLGYFGSEMDLVEKWQLLSPSGGGWQQIDLTAYLDIDGRMCDFLLAHSYESSVTYLGIRDGDDAATSRLLTEHEAESSGAGGEYTGFGISAKSNSTGKVYIRAYSASDVYYLTGYFKPASSYNISNTPSSEALGILAVSTSYYAYGSAPSNPVVDGECTFAVTNNGASAIDLDMKIADFTGGVGWNIVSSSPGANEVRVTAYYSGQDPASGLVLANTDAEFYDSLAASAHIHWDFKIETGSSFTDGTAKSATLTITATAED